jgi:hypothetical protein
MLCYEDKRLDTASYSCLWWRHLDLSSSSCLGCSCRDSNSFKWMAEPPVHSCSPLTQMMANTLCSSPCKWVVLPTQSTVAGQIQLHQTPYATAGGPKGCRQVHPILEEVHAVQYVGGWVRSTSRPVVPAAVVWHVLHGLTDMFACSWQLEVQKRIQLPGTITPYIGYGAP